MTQRKEIPEIAIDIESLIKSGESETVELKQSTGEMRRIIETVGAFAWRDDHFRVWREFEWEGKRYFSWVFSPRIIHTGLFDYENDWDHEKPDTSNNVQITFLKILLAAEKLAGGTVYVGNDVICPKRPDDTKVHDEEFFFPAELDFTLPNWREAENIEPENPHLVF